MKKLFLIIGAPGSGKTTDAELIAKNNKNISHYSTGDMLRAEIARNTPRGQEINKYTSKGKIVPIAIVIDTIVGAIKASENDIVIIDGYPRSIEQMMELDTYLKDTPDVKLTNVIEVEVDEQIARDRVLGRARGDDDSHTIFDSRMKVYTAPLQKIRNFYKKRDLLKVISGEGTIEEIVSEMESFIKAKI